MLQDYLVGKQAERHRKIAIFSIFFFVKSYFLIFLAFFLLFSPFPGDEENITAKVFLALFLHLSQPNCPFTHRPLPEKDCRSPDQIDYHHTFTAFTINITIINRNINSGNNGENDQQKKNKIHSFPPTKLPFLLLAILFNLKRLAPIAAAARVEGEA